MSEHLKPIKHAQGDLFICDITDVILKDEMASMEHPFYSLSKKPDREPRRYEHNGNWIEFRPSIKGLPTIYDKDLIIYAISQLIAGIKEGRPASKNVRIDPYSFLVFTERSTGGRDYAALCDSLDRIDGTRFRTNILYDGTRSDTWMGIIDGAKLDTDERTGKLRSLEITLSDMVMSSVMEMDVLTLHKDYFRLTRPIERRVYEIARKAVGQNESWSFNMATLHKKSGSKGPLFEFRRQMKPIIEKDPLPDYMVIYDQEKDKITFVNRGSMPTERKKADENAKAILRTLSPDIYHEARLIAEGWDIYQVADAFAAWWTKIEKPMPKNTDALFLKFCKTWQAKRGRP